MRECVLELEEKVRDARGREVSHVSKKPQAFSKAPEAPDPWGSSARPPAPPVQSTTPPGAASTAPDPLATPIPGLLRSRRSG